MKKTSIFIMLLIALLCFSSCQMSDDPAKIPTYGDNTANRGREGEYLVTVSRIRGIKDSAQSRGFDEDGEWEEGEDIVGVLLAFHNGKSTKKDENGFIKNDPYAFYIEELDYIGYNGDGMGYNYILYIPSVIQDVYEEAGGVNPYSGNPFWWYMKTYLNMSLPEIVDDYEDVIDFLLRNGKKLPYPKVEDVKGHWSSHNASINIRNVYGISNYPEYADVSRIGFWYDQEKNTLYMPSSVTGEYTAGGGSVNNRDALDWYISTYMKEETKEFANPNEFIKSDVFKSVIESIDISKPAYKPSGKDLKVEFTTQMDDELDDDAKKISLNYCSFYYDGMIRNEDGEPIKDGKIHILSQGSWKNGYEGVAVYFPEFLLDEYRRDWGEYIYNGDLFWWFIQTYHGVTDDMITSYFDDNCSMPIEEMEKYITIPDTPRPEPEIPEKPEGIEEIHHYTDNSNNEIVPGKITVISDIKDVTTIDGIVYIENRKPGILLEFGAPYGETDGAFYLPEPDRNSLYNNRYHFYVPSMIQKAYAEGNGKDPNTGNPLWWYLSTYYNVSLSDVKNSLLSLFDVLLNNANNLIVPDSKDVTGHWIESSSNIKYRFAFSPDNYPDNAMTEMGIYFSKAENTIYLPISLIGEYAAAGMGIQDQEALYWYLKQYHGYKNNADIDRMLSSDNATETLIALDYEAHLPSGKDVSAAPRQRLYDTFVGDFTEYRFASSEFYYPGRILDANGNPINDDKIHFLTRDDGGIILYFPEWIKLEQEESRGEFHYNGNLFWNYLKDHHNVTGDEIHNIIKNKKFNIPKEKLIEWMQIPETR